MDYEYIYFNNNYEIAKNFIFTLKEFENVKSHKLFKKEFAIITAFNPLTEKLDLQTNLKSNRSLEEEITSLGYEYLEARGFLDEHSEDGFLIFDISFEDAIKLARMYKQYAIFYNSNSKIGYYLCENKNIIVEKKKELS